MNTGRIISAFIFAAMVTAPAERASADAGDAIAGAIVGGIIGNAIARDQAKKKKVYVTRKTSSKPSISSAQRAENMSVQHALNYFGFNAGGADGVLGRNSRAAISGYQAHLGYTPTGQLTQFEKDFLLTSHNRALAGGPATAQMIASNPMGTRGLLITYRDQLATGNYAAGTVPPTAMPGTTVVVAPQTVVTTPEVAEPEVTEAAAKVDTGPAIPNFAGSTATMSLASHCNAINLLTNANGGFSTLDGMSDPKIALNEQFCLARTYAIANSEKLIADVQGFTPEQITEQCLTIGPLLKDQVTALSLKPLDEVKKETAAFVLSSGMAPNQLIQTAKICLGTGYRIDDLDVALASSLLLVALGESVYAELPGHHLVQGFGATKRADLAVAWYDAAADALDRGAVPVVAPNQQGRTELIRAASEMVSGVGTLQPAIDVQETAPATTLPAFTSAN